MNTILNKIIESKRREVAERRDLIPIKLLERELFFPTQPVSLKRYLERDDLVGVIAEIKRQSPSKGILKQYISVEEISIGYMQAGASALSILTDKPYFGGSTADLTVARRCNYAPILRKDFTLDEYQIIEAKAFGADVILLIAAVLSVQECAALAQTARSLGLEVLLEVHTEQEIQTHLNPHISLVGVNNRDLHDFSVSLERSESLIGHIPREFVAIAESGISDPRSVMRLKRLGFRGFLIGEAFMRETEPHHACHRFIRRLESLARHESRR